MNPLAVEGKWLQLFSPPYDGFEATVDDVLASPAPACGRCCVVAGGR